MVQMLSYIVDGRIGGRSPKSVQNAVEAIEDGVDVVVGQGTGMDAGPYYLGTDEVLPLRRPGVEPILLAAKRTNTPFIFSMGGAAGADVHLNKYLDVVEEIAQDNDEVFDIAKISGEIDPDYLLEKVRSGVEIERSMDTPRLTEHLTEEDVEEAVRIQAQLGPEPIVEALGSDLEDIDGVITGRALDVGVMMAYPLFKGVDRSTAAHVGKVIECASMCAEPQAPFEGVVVDIDIADSSFTVQSCSPEVSCTINSVSAHSLYERENPFKERNPGGVLDVSEANYEQVNEDTVRARGAVWRDVPYTVKLEGAKSIGYQAATICGIRDPHMIESIDSVLEGMEETMHETEPDADFNTATQVYGRDGVLGQSEPTDEIAHEIGVLVLVTADSQELADELATTARLQLFMCDFPGRRSIAGNTAVPLQKTAFPLGESYVFNIWHLLPLDDPSEPFEKERIKLGSDTR